MYNEFVERCEDVARCGVFANREFAKPTAVRVIFLVMIDAYKMIVL